MQIKAKVKSNQKHNLVSWYNDYLHVKIKSAPVEGQANRELVELIATSLGLSKSCVTIKKGNASPYKTLVVDARKDYVLDRLSRYELKESR